MSMTYNKDEPKPVAKPVPDIPDSVFAQFSMKGKVAIVTGAGAGLGLAAVEALAEAGANIALWYNSNEETIATAKSVAEKYNVKTKAYKIQVQNQDQVKKGVEDVVKDFDGRLDIMIANAGAAKSEGILEQSDEDWKRQVDINYYGVVYCARAAGHHFKKQGSGNFIITSSISAHIVNVPIDQPCYNSTKAAVTMLGKCLAREWREFARVNIISPGYFKTNLGASDRAQSEAYRMSVMGRQGDVKEIKGLFLYLSSNASTYVTGSDFIIDGGYTLP